MPSPESSVLNKIDFNKSPHEYPDNDKGNLRLYYELELLKSTYEGTECDACFGRYLAIMDALGNRGQFIDYSSDLKIDKQARSSDWNEYFNSVIMKPIPTPSEGESQDKFISRCISTLSHHDPGKDKKQVIAICYSTWRDSKK